MVPERRGGFGTLVKLGLIAGGVYLAYRQRGARAAERTAGGGRAESPSAGSAELGRGIDAAAREIGDFTARVLKAAKRGADTTGK
jgi:hypothetical protein